MLNSVASVRSVRSSFPLALPSACAKRLAKCRATQSGISAALLPPATSESRGASPAAADDGEEEEEDDDMKAGNVLDLLASDSI